MPDRLALMLDSAIFAVDKGLSYDGIVSIPELGLEDFGRRPGLPGLVDALMEQAYRIKDRLRFPRRPGPPKLSPPTPPPPPRPKDPDEALPRMKYSPVNDEALPRMKEVSSETLPRMKEWHQ